ncbi:MAG: MOSC domain-containing protein [Leptolyngbyaceae cyanobacterium SM1_1_3]|nr:MOSC domain-containing protein [Leptolyngbyaceae cyanobacterium SM1_1_3]NJN04452.1 MOSC domain-containing protein [Leptolyngbyaceae cyanobacterium RM1_1_2]NJO10059.1 MOSC domain-containing protein [Leptolyngbyaceae cyanobacterium SL_1_1]
MHVVSVNISEPEAIKINSRVVTTGIFKHPVAGKVQVSAQGLAGDTIADKKYHGGLDQAVYLYSAEDYAWWADQLQRDVSMGTFGDNLTLSSFGPDPLRVGDRFQINSLLLEVTFPRIPCATLGARMEGAAFVKRFVEAQRPGAYARVLAAGELQAGDPVEMLPTADGFPTIVELYELWHAKQHDSELLHRGLAAPISERARATLQLWAERA